MELLLKLKRQAMAKLKKSEEPTLAIKPSKTTAKVAAPKVEALEVVIDPETILEMDGKPMLWNSRTHIKGIGTVTGPVKCGDFARFSDLVKHLDTDPMTWISNEDEALKQLKVRQKDLKLKNGFS